MSKDIIYRQDAIEAIERAATKEAARWSVKELPAAEPDVITMRVDIDKEQFKKAWKQALASSPLTAFLAEKKGKWIPKEERAKQEIFICSECGGWAYSPWIGSRKTPKPNWCKYAFCPNCGTKMED